MEERGGSDRHKLTVAVVGVGSFGFWFLPLYLRHPDVGRVVVCDPARDRLALVARAFGITETLTDFEAVLASPTIDAVHLVTPMHLHAVQAVAALDAGKHCACAVPAGLTLQELRDLVKAERRSGRSYMMMETAVYTREFFYVRKLVDSGALGRIQFLRGAHLSDYELWPSWKWYPPMHYATHAVAPLLALTNTQMRSVRCLGSGSMPDSLRGALDNSYPVETAIFELEQSDTVAEVTRSIFRTAREEQESFSIYGELASFEWQQLASENPLLFRVSPTRDKPSEDRASGATWLNEASEALAVTPNTLSQLLPSPRSPTVEIERVTPGNSDETLPPELRTTFSGHGGSEPHLVHEFVRSIVEQRPSAVSAAVAANWTAPGICAHESALQSGAIVDIPGVDDVASPTAGTR